MAGAKVGMGAAEGGTGSVVVGGVASVLLVVGDVGVDEAERPSVGVAVAAGWPCGEQAAVTSVISTHTATTCRGREGGLVDDTLEVFQMPSLPR
ncbi:MAG: hypothetical protein MK196_07205 [Acidimicrobiales bacterium]|nr:hypothetical protein [Acidimicrobiales bacterium]